MQVFGKCVYLVAEEGDHGSQHAQHHQLDRGQEAGDAARLLLPQVDRQVLGQLGHDPYRRQYEGGQAQQRQYSGAQRCPVVEAVAA